MFILFKCDCDIFGIMHQNPIFPGVVVLYFCARHMTMLPAHLIPTIGRVIAVHKGIPWVFVPGLVSTMDIRTYMDNYLDATLF